MPIRGGKPSSSGIDLCSRSSDRHFQDNIHLLLPSHLLTLNLTGGPETKQSLKPGSKGLYPKPCKESQGGYLHQFLVKTKTYSLTFTWVCPKANPTCQLSYAWLGGMEVRDGSHLKNPGFKSTSNPNRQTKGCLKKTGKGTPLFWACLPTFRFTQSPKKGTGSEFRRVPRKEEEKKKKRHAPGIFRGPQRTKRRSEAFVAGCYDRCPKSRRRSPGRGSATPAWGVWGVSETKKRNGRPRIILSS